MPMYGWGRVGGDGEGNGAGDGEVSVKCKSPHTPLEVFNFVSTLASLFLADSSQKNNYDDN